MRPRPAVLRLVVPGCLLVSLLALNASPVRSGQVRVTSSSFSYAPSAVNVNPGDHVVWINTVSTHPLTAGDSATGTPSGEFSYTLNASTTTSASWKTTGPPRVVPYYCDLHFPDMAGRVIISASTVPVADFRITEVQFNVPGGQDLIEIANLGTAAGDFSKYRLKVSGVGVQTTPYVVGTTFPVPAGGRVVVRCNATGANTASNLFLPAITDLPATGSVALYVPHQQTGTTLNDPLRIIDFVQWGAGAQENEATAVTAGLWAAGASLNDVADTHSLEFCGTSGQYGASFWAEISTPTFGTNGLCTTSGRPTTWGRLKSLYR